MNNDVPGHRRVSPERLLEFVSAVYRGTGVSHADAPWRRTLDDTLADPERTGAEASVDASPTYD